MSVPPIPATAVVAKPKRNLGNKILRFSAISIAVLALLVGTLIALLYRQALTTERPVGFQVVQVRSSEAAPMTMGIWYPSNAAVSAQWLGSQFMQVAANGPVTGQQLPLIVISHGTGGGIVSHADLALALAAAGYVVAAPMHSDNYLDQSSVGSPAYFTGRTAQLRSAIDYMLQQWPAMAQLDAGRIGVYGFSIGAFTALTAAGAQPDLRGVAQYCATQSEFACEMLRQSGSFLLGSELPDGFDQFGKDERIKALVLAAPGLGFSLNNPAALSQVKVPVQLWQGDKDDTVPDATNAKVIRDQLGNQVEFHQVPGAAHLSFLLPCGFLSILPTCHDPAGFDRKGFHAGMNPQLVEFFNKQLPH